jgi:hypothetical protein
MSILLEAPVRRTNLVGKSDHCGHNSSAILLISAAITVAIVLLMYGGISYTEGTIKSYSDCREKIIGFEENGMYQNPDQFKSALSYCDVK